MPKILIFAIVFITLALVFYTIGVFGEKKKGNLTIFHTVLFWLGFACDSIGTSIMGQISKASEKSGTDITGLIHSVTGMLALILMAFHAVWATVIILRKDEKAKAVFHKFSIIVWAIWLIPYLIGVFIGMMH